MIRQNGFRSFYARLPIVFARTLINVRSCDLFHSFLSKENKNEEAIFSLRMPTSAQDQQRSLSSFREDRQKTIVWTEDFLAVYF